jgi:IclR family acetate operon transcriptional repressor
MSVKRVQSATRVLATLETLAEHQPIGVAALARLLADDKSAVQRALVTLAGAGWIRPTGDEVTRWELTSRAVVVASHAQARSDTGRRVRAQLEALQAKTGETAIFAVADAGRVTIVDVVESREMVRSAPHVGMVVPTDTSATSLAILAHLDADDRHALLGSAPGPALLAELDEVRRRGWALNASQPGATSVGAVVLDRDGRPVGAIAIAALAERLPSVDHETYGQLVADAARALSA